MELIKEYKMYNKLEEMVRENASDKHHWISKDKRYTTAEGDTRTIKNYFAIPFTESEKLYEILETNNHLYEMLPEGQPIYPYFDCEMEGIGMENYETKINAFIQYLCELFLHEFGVVINTDEDLVVLNSCTSSKLSYHIIIKSCYFRSVQELKVFISWMFDNFTKHNDADILTWKFKDSETRFIFDRVPYGRNQNYRFVNQSKLGKQSVLTSNCSVKNSLVRLFEPFHFDNIQALSIDKYRQVNNTTTSTSIVTSERTTISIPTQDLVKYEQLFNDILNNNLLDGVINGDYEDRLRVGFAIANTWSDDSKALELYLKFITRRPTADRDEYIQKFRSFQRDGVVTFATIIYYAKNINDKLTTSLVSRVFGINHELIKPSDQDIFYTLSREELTTGLLAKLFKMLYGHKFISQDAIMYGYNGILWKAQPKPYDSLTIFVMNEFLPTLVDIVKVKYLDAVKNFKTNLNEDETQKFKTIVNNLQKLLTSLPIYLNERNKRLNVIGDIVQLLSNESIKFDTRPELFAFNNAIYDMKQGKFVEPNPNDYVSLSCGWDYDFNMGEDVKTIRRVELNKVIDSILPNAQVKNFYLSLVSTSMIGALVEYCIILTGGGGNGKSLLSELIMYTLGQYAYDLPTTFITKEISTGADPQTANLHMKRFVRFTEPDSKQRIKASTLKTITGSHTLNARQLYSSKSEITLTGTLFGECNNIPRLDEINPAIVRRMKLIPFNSRFVTQQEYDELPENERIGVGIRNIKYKSREFKEDHKQVLFELLAPMAKSYLENGNVVDDPNECNKLARNYFAGCDDLYGWFTDNFEKIEDNNVIMYCDDIYAVFKNSEFFENLSKSDKRKYNKTNFYEMLEKNVFLKSSFKGYRDYIGSVRLNKPALAGWVRTNGDELTDEENTRSIY